MVTWTARQPSVPARRMRNGGAEPPRHQPLREAAEDGVKAKIGVLVYCQHTYFLSSQGLKHIVLKYVIIVNVLHDILYLAVQNIAQLINRVDLHILIVPQTIQL